MFKHILIPVVPEPCSEQAAQMGLDFAKRTGARVTFAYVMTKLDTTTYARGVLSTWHDHALKAGVISDEMLLQNLDMHLGDAIAKEASQKDYDLILMGTHAREGLNRLLLGSVTERVVRVAKIPVLVSRAQTTGAFTRILVPVDTTLNSLQVVEHAKALALELPAKLHFVHVIPDTPVPLGDPVGAFTAFDYAGLSKSLEETGTLALEKAVEQCKELTPTTSILHAHTNQIHNVILGAAKDVHADLIVMITHARAGLDRLLLGSVAEGVVHHANAPVLLIRPAVVSALDVNEFEDTQEVV
jgi:nucleotide-binding universal stress UspA family protein